MRRTTILVTAAVAVAVGLASVAAAELSEKYRDWADGPAGYLMTKQEKKAWKEIRTDASAKDFIELFWARRDPDPSDSFNPFRAEFEARLRYARENFSYEDNDGALTDRGRILLLLGPPHQAEKRAPTETVELMDNTTAGTDEVRANAELWVYDPARLPEDLNVKGSRLLFVFYEQKAETNNFVLDRSHREATMGMRTLSKAPEVFVVNPDLDEVPKPVSLPEAEPAGDAALAAIDGGAGEWNEDAEMVLDVGVADAVHRPIWLHLELPEGAPELDRIAGRVMVDDQTVSTFETDADPIETKAGTSAYHLTFPVAAGDYRVEVVGLDGGDAVAVMSGEVSAADVPDDGTWVSPLWIGLQAIQDPEFRLGDPFTFGGWHLVPLAGRPLDRNNELSYFGFVVRPGAAAGDRAELESKITLKKDGKRLGAPLKQPVGAARISGDLFMFADALNLSGLPEPGAYTLEFEISDPIGDVSSERTIELDIVE